MDIIRTGYYLDGDCGNECFEGDDVKILCTAEDNHRQAKVTIHLREEFTKEAANRELQVKFPGWNYYDEICLKVGRRKFILERELR